MCSTIHSSEAREVAEALSPGVEFNITRREIGANFLTRILGETLFCLVDGKEWSQFELWQAIWTNTYKHFANASFMISSIILAYRSKQHSTIRNFARKR